MLPPSALISVNRQKKVAKKQKNYGLETTASDYATGLPFSLSQCAHPHETLETQHKFCSLKKSEGEFQLLAWSSQFTAHLKVVFFVPVWKLKIHPSPSLFFCLKQTQENPCCFDSTSSGC